MFGYGWLVGASSNDSEQAARRVIAHIDADAFHASVHLLEDPSLAGRPVIVAGSGARSIVTTASYEARRYGIGSAMPASQARRLCPHAMFLRPDFELYRDYSRRAMAIVAETVSCIEPLSLDEAYLDITQLELTEILVDRPCRHHALAACRAIVADPHDDAALRKQLEDEKGNSNFVRVNEDLRRLLVKLERT